MSHLRTLVITATRSGAISTAVINRGVPGPVGPAGPSTGGGGTWGSITGTIGDQTDLTPAAIGAEDALGDPATTGAVLTSTALGVRSWTAGTLSLPAGASISLGAESSPGAGDQGVIVTSAGGYIATGLGGYIATGTNSFIDTSPGGYIAIGAGGNIDTQAGGSITTGAGHLTGPATSGTIAIESGNIATATAALGLKTASTTVSVDSATAPTTGQVLTAISTTAATWQTPSGGGTWAGDIADINLDGGTDIGADLADADLILVDDGATGTNRKSAISRVWTYIKSKLSTSGDTITVNGPLILSSGTRPTSSGTGAPAAASLLTRDDLIFLVPQWKFPTLAPASTVTSSGGTNNYDGGNALKTGTTDGGGVCIRHWGASVSAPLQYRGGATGSFAGDRTIVIAFQLNVSTANATGIFRMQAGRASSVNTIADFTSAITGVSLKVENLACKLQVANGTTLATSATLHTLTANTIVDVVVSVAGGVATLYIDGTSVGTLSGAPTTSVAVGGGAGFSGSVTNAGTAAAYDVIMGQPRILVY